MPMPVVMGSTASSWSVASISTSSLMFSTGAPRSRRTSERSVSSPPVACACSVRVSVSGLYWNTMTLASGLNGSSPTRAPLRKRGPNGVLLTSHGSVHGARDPSTDAAGAWIQIVHSCGERRQGVGHGANQAFGVACDDQLAELTLQALPELLDLPLRQRAAGDH